MPDLPPSPSPSPSHLLSARGLTSAHAGPFDLDVLRGECVAIVGKSGTGKSLFLRLIADLDPGDGAVSLDGVSRDAIAAPIWRRRVVYQAAEPAWWAPTVADHLPADPPASIGEWMDALGLAHRLLTASLPSLSTGERQRMALVRSLAVRPAVLLLDEPTASLDPASTLEVEALLRRQMALGMAVVLVTHSHEQAARMSDRIHEMSARRLRPL